MTYTNVETDKLQKIIPRACSSTDLNQFSMQQHLHIPGGSRQHSGEFDKVIVNFTLPPNRAIFAVGLWAIKITKLTAGAKRFRDPREGLP